MSNASQDQGTRRDFLYVATAAVGAITVGGAVWPLINQMNPSADVKALASIEVDVSKIAVGQSITVKWRGKPVFIRHRTENEITTAQSVQLSDLKDPQKDDERVTNPQYLVMLGVCTHLGCVPLGQKTGEMKGQYDGWFCPCHGSHYDISGRIRKGPAPLNLEIPPYQFASNSVIKIG